MARSPLTPSAVVDAAVDLADELGLDAVTLSAVARRLGVQTPSLYSHVRSLTDLHDRIAARALGVLASRIAAEIAGRAGLEALSGFADAHRSFQQSSPGLWESLQRRTGPEAARSEEAASVVTLTEAALRGYDLSDDDRIHAVRLVGSTINGFLRLERIGAFEHRSPDLESSWRWAITSLDVALRAQR